MDEETIQIPISEYENFRKCFLYQDKQPLIRELQQLLQDRDEDLQRYKEKLEQCDSVLHRTQKQLDKFMQFNKVDRPIKVLVARSVNIPNNRPEKSDPEKSDPKVVARALDSAVNRKATEHDETTNATMSSHATDSDDLKSLPLGINMPGFAPGMSTALLQKLVSENLRLRKQLEAMNNGKPLKVNPSASV